VPGTFDKILSTDSCLLQSEPANQVLQLVDRYCREKELKPYGIRSHEGFLRFLVIRESSHTAELMVNIVTAFKQPEMLQPLAELLISKIPEVASVVNNINTKKAQIAFGEEEVLLAGQSFITDRLCGMDFKISANSFFQTNTLQAERLYDLALNYARLSGNEKVWDLYSGTGTISLLLAQKAAAVTGFELVDSAVRDAVENAARHRVSNVSFIAGDLLHNIDEAEYVPDVIVTDPPRSGMHPKLVKKLDQVPAHRLIYVSCNPTTMARDISALENFRLVEAQPVDMFPHTYHIETVALLERR